MTFKEFKKSAGISMTDICRIIFLENRKSLKIKKEKTAVKNLENILKITLKLSNAVGFHTMSLRDLSKETGLSMGALYSYFSNKDELLEMIQNHGLTYSARILQNQISQCHGPREKLTTAIQTHLYLSEEMQEWFYFSYMETKNLNKDEKKKAIASELGTEQIFIDILEEGKGEKIFSLDNPVLTAAVIKAMLQDWYLKRWKYSRRKVSVDEYAAFIIKMVEAYVF